MYEPTQNVIINRIQIVAESEQDRMQRQQLSFMGQMGMLMQYHQMSLMQLAARKAFMLQQSQSPSAPQIEDASVKKEESKRDPRSGAEDAEFTIVESPKPSIQLESLSSVQVLEKEFQFDWKYDIEEIHKCSGNFLVVRLHRDEARNTVYSSVYAREASLTKYLYKKNGSLAPVSISENSKQFADLVKSLKEALSIQKKVFLIEEVEKYSDDIFYIEEVGHGSAGRKALVSKDNPMTEFREHRSLFQGKEPIWSNFDPQRFSVTWDRNNKVFVFKPV